jgi:DNA-binding NtrC family response regulator
MSLPAVTPRVLFVDDDESILLTLPRILEKNGWEIVTAKSFQEAVFKIHSVSFDLLLTDMNIDEEGDGLLVIAEMRRRQPDCLNFVMTGYPRFEPMLKAIAPPLQKYFFKPVELNDLISSLKEYLDKRKTSKPAGISLLDAPPN